MAAPDNLKWNFCLPVDCDRLRNERLKLVPFESDFNRHSQLYVEESISHPDQWKFFPYGPFSTFESFQSWFNGRIHVDQKSILFAIILEECTIKRTTKMTGPGEEAEQREVIKVERGTMAGVVGLLNTDLVNSSVEIGHVLTFKQFQRTFVTTVAHGLLLQHLLNEKPNFHFRRVQWQAFSLNERSIHAAQRLGFVLEGIIRWQRVLPQGAFGLHESDLEALRASHRDNLPPSGPDGRLLDVGRHSAMLSLCWDDWLGGARDRLTALMAR